MSTPPATPSPPAEPAYTIRAIPAALIPRFWPLAEAYVRRALDRATGEFSSDDLYRFLRQSLLQLWLVYDGTRVIGAVTTEIVVFPKRRRLRVITLSGMSLDAWVDELDTRLQEWALTNRCDGIEAYVRKGFVPYLGRQGYKHKLTMVYKPVPAQPAATTPP